MKQTDTPLSGRGNPTPKKKHGFALIPCGPNESVQVGNQIEIRVAEQRSGRVTLAIRAPKSLSINRMHSRNDDGRGVGAPQPSATNSPSSTKTQE